MIRHQLPVYSPLPLGALMRALGGRFQGGDDPLATLSELLAEERGAKRVILYGSGTQALQVALRVAVDSVGGEVALPAYSCFDVATAAVGAQVRVRLYDLEPRTLGPDLASLEAALQAGARVVVAGPLYGIPLDWGPVQEIVRRYGAVLVEDAAQAHGCRNGVREAGMTGDLSVLSFGRGKGWTGGAGGALLVRDAALDVISAAAVGGGNRVVVALSCW
jgi:dTDP-4-amino-4,6-dideoxygalactose transaminase